MFPSVKKQLDSFLSLGFLVCRVMLICVLLVWPGIQWVPIKWDVTFPKPMASPQLALYLSQLPVNYVSGCKKGLSGERGAEAEVKWKTGDLDPYYKEFQLGAESGVLG